MAELLAHNTAQLSSDPSSFDALRFQDALNIPLPGWSPKVCTPSYVDATQEVEWTLYSGKLN